MWWLIPMSIGLGLKILYDAVSDEEYEARERWEDKREEVTKSLEEQQKNIEDHLTQLQQVYNFHHLVNLHYSSMQAANSAYQLLDDVNSSFKGISKMINKSKEQRSALQTELKKARKSKDKKSIYEVIEQLKMLNNLRKNLFLDRNKIKTQKEQFLSEVKRLNNQTRELKELIRDNCTYGGQEWYDRLEVRKQARRR